MELYETLEKRRTYLPIYNRHSKVLTIPIMNTLECPS